MRNLFRLCIKLYLLIAVLGAWTSSNAQIIETKSISCPGANDGQLNFHFIFGAPPFTYAWTYNSAPFVADTIIKGASPGYYTVIVTDATATSYLFEYDLKDPIPLNNSFPSITPNSNWPANNGAFSITTTGGSGSFKYTLKDSLSRTTMTMTSANYTTFPTSGFMNLPSGTYYLNTTDIHGCKRMDTVRIAENRGYGELGANYNGIIDPDTTACYKDITQFSLRPDTLNVQFPVTVLIDNLAPTILLGYKRVGDTLRMHTGLGASVLIDTIFPVATFNYITRLDPPIAPETLNKATLGGVSAQLAPGFHIIQVYTNDGRGFRYSWDVDSTSSPLSINIATLVHNPCYNDNKGSITATAEGSYEGITLTLSGNGPTAIGNPPTPAVNAATTVSRSALIAGVYTLVATDWTGCTRTDKVTITQPDEALRIVWDPAKNARCPYSLDGAANLRRVDGATNPINFSWSNGETTPDLTNISPGTYILTVTDANGCIGQDSVKIEGERRNCFYNIITPNGDGFNDKFDLSDFCVGVQMKAVIFNEAGKKIAELDETNPTWDAYDPITPPTGTSSTYTCFVSLYEDGVKTVEFAESFSVVFPQ